MVEGATARLRRGGGDGGIYVLPTCTSHAAPLHRAGPRQAVVCIHSLHLYTMVCVHVRDGYSKEFEVKVRVHQGFVLNLLLCLC